MRLRSKDGPIFGTTPELEPHLRACGIDRTASHRRRTRWWTPPASSPERTACPGRGRSSAGYRSTTRARPAAVSRRSPATRRFGPSGISLRRARSGLGGAGPGRPSLEVVSWLDLPFDVVAVFPNHLRHVPTLAKRVPALTMVIDHLSKPPIRARGSDPGRANSAPPPPARGGSPSSRAEHGGRPPLPRGRDRHRPGALYGLGPGLLRSGAREVRQRSPIPELAGDDGPVWKKTAGLIEGLGAQDRAAILGELAARVDGPLSG